MLGLAVACCGCPDDESRSAARSRTGDQPNIILLTVESLRADHIGCYGYERDTTPHLDALAMEGVLFERAHSVTSWTLASHASIFTGLYPSAHRTIGPKDKLGDAYVTLAEELSKCGYQTAGVVSGTYLQQYYNLHQGFEYYDTDPVRAPNTPAEEDVTNKQMQEAMFKFLREHRDTKRPFFLFGYYWDPHHLYIPPAPFDEMFVPPGAKEPKTIQFHPLFQLGKHLTEANLAHVVAQYDGEIRCTDEYLGRLFALLRELDLWENTAIIVTADHGEEFYDHGRNSHKNNLYQESIHVPLVIKPPGKAEPRRDSRLVNLIDLYPTVLDFAGCKASQPHSGHSLLDGTPDADRPVFFELKTIWTFNRKSTGEEWQEVQLWTAVRQGDYKLIHINDISKPGTVLSGVAGSAGPGERWELYDLAADPAEKSPLGVEHEEIVGRLQAEMERWSADMKSMSKLWQAGGQAQLSEEEESRLRGLGYLP